MGEGGLEDEDISHFQQIHFSVDYIFDLPLQTINKLMSCLDNLLRTARRDVHTVMLARQILNYEFFFHRAHPCSMLLSGSGPIHLVS